MFQPRQHGNVQKPPARSVADISQFKGVDLFNSPSNVDDSRSPEAPNMIRDVPGKVRKRMGYEQTDSFPGRINGVFRLVDDNGAYEIVHAGNRLYRVAEDGGHEVLYSAMADTRSRAWQFAKKLYIMDGRQFLVYGELDNDTAAAAAATEDRPKKSYQVKPVTEIATVPTVMISRNPDGGGTSMTSLTPLNLLSRKWTESFYGKASVTEYQLTAGYLDETPVTAKVLQADGRWKDLKEGTDFSVNRTTGKVTFTTAPGASPLEGQDNVKITASKVRGDFEEETLELDGVAERTEYPLPARAIGSKAATVKLLQANGTWTEMKENSGFTLDRLALKITFTAAPGASPVADNPRNIRVTCETLTMAYEDRVNRCDVSTLYGVNGAADRLFVTGNPKYPNHDWYSQMNDPTYFGDLWYAVLGQDSSRVLGYTVVNDRLAAHKDEGEDGRNVILRQGVLEDGKPAFRIVNSLQGAGAIGKYSFAYLQNEPLFLTRLGVCAITPADITGERYTQNRSFYLNKAITEELGLEEAVGFNYKDFYLLALNGRVYVLDGLQKTYERNAPYSTYQYEGYHWTNIPARVFWEQSGRLYFGTEDGRVCRFYDAPEAQGSYNDCGVAIEAHWDLPDMDGKLFYKNKTFRYFSIRLASAVATGVRVWVQKKGLWSLLFDAGAKARYFDFTWIEWDKLSLSCDTTPKSIGGKIKVKKVDKARYRLENNELNEPFGVYNVALEYTESGNYKGG